MHSDPISDMLIRMKNAARAGKPSVAFPYSRLKLAIAEMLKTRGYVSNINKRGKKVIRTIEVDLAYNGREPRLHEVVRMSKPSRRLYARASAIHPVRQGRGLAVYSTPQGLLTDSQARKANMGGEFLFKIW